MRLRNPENFPGFRLGEPACLDDAVDLQSQTRFHQLLVRFGQSKIGKNVAAASGDAGLSSGFFLVVILLLPFCVISFCETSN